jgi:hypothetical protein
MTRDPLLKQTSCGQACWSIDVWNGTAMIGKVTGYNKEQANASVEETTAETIKPPGFERYVHRFGAA